MISHPIGIELLRRLVRDEPWNGHLFWIPRPLDMFPTPRNGRWWNTRFAGQRAGNVNREGYIKLMIFNHAYSGHRVMWALCWGEWPTMQIDHINGVKTDNHIENLRLVTQSENCRNMKLPSDNTSGHMGVIRSKDKKRWYARIWAEGRSIQLGTFDTVEAAGKARKSAEALYGFHPNHGRL